MKNEKTKGCRSWFRKANYPRNMRTLVIGDNGFNALTPELPFKVVIGQ